MMLHVLVRSCKEYVFATKSVYQNCCILHLVSLKSLFWKHFTKTMCFLLRLLFMAAYSWPPAILFYRCSLDLLSFFAA